MYSSDATVYITEHHVHPTGRLDGDNACACGFHGEEGRGRLSVAKCVALCVCLAVFDVTAWPVICWLWEFSMGGLACVAFWCLTARVQSSMT